MSKFYYCPTCGFTYHKELAEHYDMKCDRCNTKLKPRSDKD